MNAHFRLNENCENMVVDRALSTGKMAAAAADSIVSMVKMLVDDVVLSFVLGFLIASIAALVYLTFYNNNNNYKLRVYTYKFPFNKRHDELILELHHSAKNCIMDKKHVEKCKQLLKMKPSLVNKKMQPNGYTPFHRACLYGCAELIEHMLSVGADVRLPSHSGDSPIHLVAYGIALGVTNTPRALTLLRDAGCSLNAINASGNTPLHLAARHGHDALVACLLTLGADPRPIMCRVTPTDCALKYGNTSSAALIEMHAKNAKNRSDYTSSAFRRPINRRTAR